MKIKNPDLLVVNLNFAIDRTVLVKNFEPGSVYRVADVKTQPGGKGVNVARVLKTLGINSTLTGFIAGYNGKWICSALHDEDLKVVPVMCPSGENRVCMSIVDSARGIATDINEEGNIVPKTVQNKFVKQFKTLLKKCDMIAFSGRLANGLSSDFFYKLIIMAKKEGKPCALDTSGLPLKLAVQAGPFLIKINRDEFEEIAGARLTDKSFNAFYKKIHALGTKYFVVTDGPGAVYACTPENFWKFYPPKIKALAPVGAGDSFTAGLIYAFMKGMSRQECVKFAMGCSASDCLSIGAGIVNKKQCAMYAKKAKLVRLGALARPEPAVHLPKIPKGKAPGQK